MKGYLGLNCPCGACQALTPEERQEKHDRIQAARQKGGKTRAAQPSMQEARSKGFWATMESHPFFARKWLKKRIKQQNGLRRRHAGMRSLIARAGQAAGRRQPMK